MKTKRVVVGTMTAAILSLMVSSFPVTFAATEKVQISVGSATVKAGEEFSIDVSLTDIPGTGIQGCDFAVNYDNSIITVSSVTAGPITETGAAGADSTASVIPNFDYELLSDEGAVNLLWSTSLEDSQYWIKDDGVFCTITGTVSAAAAEGTVVDVTVTATKRDTYPDSGSANASIGIGYSNGTETIRYGSAVTAGTITVAGEETTDTTGGDIVYGDATLDGEVKMDDVIKVMCYSSNAALYPLEDQAKNNCDVYQRGDGVTLSDALSIQKKVAQVIEVLPES